MELLDILKSGDVEDLVISENIRYTSALDAEYNGMFLRLNNGFTSLYKAPDPDKHYIATNNSLLDVSNETSVLNVTIDAADADVTTQNGSVNFTCRLDNPNNQDITVEIIFYSGGVELGRDIVTLVGNELNKIVFIAKPIATTIPAGATVYVNMSSDRTVQVRGDIVETKIEITAAAAATLQLVQTAIEKHDYMLVIPTTQNLQTTLTRAEIESVIQAAGIDLPTVNVSFKIRDNSNHVFAVSYLKDYDEYGYERLTVAN